MSTTYNHGTLKQVDDNGNVKVLYPKGYASDILLSDDTTTVQEKITELNSDLGDPSSASDVEGEDAFSKIDTLYNAISSSGGERITPLKTTTFPSDGSILETYSVNENVRTVFNSDGSISEIHTKDGNVIEHKTIFNANGSISVVDVPQT